MKYTIELVNNRPQCRVATLDNKLYILEGYELFELLKDIEDDIDKFTRKDTPQSIFLRNKKRNEIIHFKNINELEKPLYDLYTKCAKKEIRDQKIEKIKTKAAITVITSGIIAAVLASKMQTNINTFTENEKSQTTTEDQLTPNEENTNKITVDDTKVIVPEEGELNTKASEEGEEVKVEPEKETIEKTFVKNIEQIPVDQEIKYDPGINARIEKFMPDIIERANRWGISPSILRDQVSQEWDGKDNNLTHVVKKEWLDFVLTVYNYDTNQFEKFVITDNPQKYDGKVDHIFTGEDLLNPKANLSAGAIILQYALSRFDYNIPLGLQAYNNGPTVVNNILKETERKTGLTREQILATNEPIWLDYTYVNEDADNDYFKNVIKHIDEDQIESKLNDVYSVNYIDENGEQQTNEVQFKLR